RCIRSIRIVHPFLLHRDAVLSASRLRFICILVPFLPAPLHAEAKPKSALYGASLILNACGKQCEAYGEQTKIHKSLSWC
ncbi:hypothetical protein, partial [Hoylesella marshii]|uniref:hypothetical protein n=1 Tax=Hoylesella marshii TaxID=189722 RepID=UPI001B7FDFF2